MAYSRETGNVNVETLTEILNVSRKGAEVIFQNENLLIISPSVQNGSDWFDIRKVNLIRFQESKKKGLLILRHSNHFLMADLNDFAYQMMQDDTIRNTSTGGEHWKFNIESYGEKYIVYNQGNRNILYSMRFSTVEGFKKESEKIIKILEPYNFVVKEEKEALIFNEKPVDLVKSEVLIPHIHQYIKSKGFNYSLDNIKNLYLSLRSKPFVIISGISGTGKTKIVQLFAESIGATEDNGQLTLIPVRPDWSDGSELLGYRDIKGEFVEGIFTGVVRAASEHLDRPYFVLLDEMNLARVEYYFSDVLSIMESRKKVDGAYTSSPLLPDIDSDSLPPNLYLIGTVNMDETTHPFSKKVLDRANTIEFNEVDLNDFSFLESAREAMPHIPLANTSLEASYVQLQDGYVQYKELIHRVSQKLDAINTYMKPMHAQIGYRVRDEICFYLMHNQESSLLSEDAAFDYCVMQKILPRLAGSGQKIRTALDNLYTHLTEEDEVRYPQSAEKVQEMLGRLDDDGFTSFWIS
ncbi:MAG: AAA family ATPase [Solibacillus sp.]